MRNMDAETRTGRPEPELQDMRGLLYSIVSAFTRALDERTHYNANHTRQVVEYTKRFIFFLNGRYEALGKGWHFSMAEEEQIVMAAYLHDVGKLVVPADVMNKATRMGKGGMERIHERYLLIKVCLKLDYLEGRIDTARYREQEDALEELEEHIRMAERQTTLPKAEISYFTKMGERSYRREDGSELPWLTPEEIANLQIENGTLNEEERKIMEYHAEATVRILREIRFGKQYDKVLEIVGGHHEFLDGSGYPLGLSGGQISSATRILTIADIYDSLVATDRPYKKPMAADAAKRILLEMAEAGKLDMELTTLFCECMQV